MQILLHYKKTTMDGRRSQTKDKNECIYVGDQCVGALYNTRETPVTLRQTAWGGGLGLFATCDIQAKTILTVYGGVLKIYTDKTSFQSNVEQTSHYMGLISNSMLIEGFKTPCIGFGMGSFVNDGKRGLHSHVNAEFVKITRNNLIYPQVYIRSLVPITKDQEIFVSYQTNYWNRVDDAELSTPEADGELNTPEAGGEHAITATDKKGKRRLLKKDNTIQLEDGHTIVEKNGRYYVKTGRPGRRRELTKEQAESHQQNVVGDTDTPPLEKMIPPLE
jgi:hypothetical protein